MKPAYKLGTLVQFTLTSTTETDTITSQVIREEGVSYGMKNYTNEVPESDILSAFRPIVKRAKKEKKVLSKKSKKSSSAEAHVK